MIVFPDTFPILETERLHLKEILMDDLDFFFDIRNNEDNNRYIGRKKSSLEQVQHFITDRIADFRAKKGIVWVIYDKESQQNIGSICFWNFDFENNSAEIGYELSPEFQGIGFMQEGLSKVIDFGFNELNLQTIEAFTDEKNTASIKVLEKFHFIQNNAFESDEVESLIMYTLTRTQL